MSAQLPLRLRWPPGQRFDTYVSNPRDGAAIALLRAIAGGADAHWTYLAGPGGCGRTHLLVATCAAAHAAGRSAQYLPLSTLGAKAAAALRGSGGSDVLALDDIDALAGDGDAEHALFDLYNRCRAEAATLIFAARDAASESGFVLPDLVSRLAACSLLRLQPLDEAQRRQALQLRAMQRGIELDAAVLDWLFSRRRRDLKSLIDTLDRVDVAALAAKRRITVPFLRDLLGAGGEIDDSDRA